MKRAELESLLHSWLKPEGFTDSAENGLQIEGCEDIDRVVCGVSANLALIDEAIDREASAVVVHHGLVWGGGVRKLSGWLGERVRRLIHADINLFAYHLPLDAHPELGNNAGLLRALGAGEPSPFGRYKGQTIGSRGVLDTSASLGSFVESAALAVGTPRAVFGDANKPVRTIAVCSGGAADLFEEAVQSGVDVYVTGEPSEWAKAIADESGVAFVALGHHATERFGPAALAKRLQEHGLDAEFVDVENPV